MIEIGPNRATSCPTGPLAKQSKSVGLQNRNLAPSNAKSSNIGRPASKYREQCVTTRASPAKWPTVTRNSVMCLSRQSMPPQWSHEDIHADREIVTVSYSLDCGAKVIIESVYDASDRSQEYYAYRYPKNDDGSWEPWNGAPRLGKSLGRCQIV